MKRIFIILLIMFVQNLRAENKRYLFTNVSSFIAADTVSSYKPDEITWLFRDSTIQVITEQEDLLLTLKEHKRIASFEDGIIYDKYRTDIGTIYVDFGIGMDGEFQQIVWVIDNNQYIFRMK